MAFLELFVVVACFRHCRNSPVLRCFVAQPPSLQEEISPLLVRHTSAMVLNTLRKPGLVNARAKSAVYCFNKHIHCVGPAFYFCLSVTNAKKCPQEPSF